MLKVAFGCAGPELLLALPTVFASRHGDTTTTIELLECLAREKPVSANQFSHSVHNTQAGLFTIATAKLGLNGWTKVNRRFFHPENGIMAKIERSIGH